MKTILFLECNISGTGVSAIKLAKERGYHTVLFTKERHYYAQLADNPMLYIDEVVELNTDSMAAILNHALDYNLYGIVAFDDYRLINAAAASHAFNLPSPSLIALTACRYKHLTRQYLHQHNANCRYKVGNIHDKFDLNNMQFPVVIKPCDDSGSNQVTICYSEEDALTAVQALSEFRVNRRGYQLSPHYLVEEFIEGDEYSAEAYWDSKDNEWTILGVTKKYTTSGQYAVEIGHDFPDDTLDIENITKTIIAWLTQIGLSHTVAHVEFKLSHSEIKLIEINPRVAGGMIDTLCYQSTGFDLVECYLSLHVKDMVYTPKLCANKQYTSIRFLTSEKPGTIIGFHANPQLSAPLLFNFVPTPIHVTTLKDSYSRLGYVITTASERYLAGKKAESWLDHVKLLYK